MMIGHVLKSMTFLLSITRRGGIIQRTHSPVSALLKNGFQFESFSSFSFGFLTNAIHRSSHAPNLIYKLHISGKYLVVFHALYPQQGQVNCITSYVTTKRRVSLKFVEPLSKTTLQKSQTLNNV